MLKTLQQKGILSGKGMIPLDLLTLPHSGGGVLFFPYYITFRCVDKSFFPLYNTSDRDTHCRSRRQCFCISGQYYFFCNYGKEVPGNGRNPCTHLNR